MKERKEGGREECVVNSRTRDRSRACRYTYCIRDRENKWRTERKAGITLYSPRRKSVIVHGSPIATLSISVREVGQCVKKCI